MVLPRPVRPALVFVLLLAAPAAALGQNRLSWNISYDDVTSGTQFGFADPAAGQTRRDTVTAVTNYLATILDARGTVGFTWQQSTNDPAIASGELAGATTDVSWVGSPALVVGNVYRQASGNGITQAELNGGALSSPGVGQVNFGKDWFATGTSGTGTPGSN